jgi:hypothetical protein
LKRRVAGIARLERDVVHLEEGPVLVRIRRFRDAPLAVKALREKGRLDRATFEKAAELEAPVFPFERTLFASLEHDLIVLATPRMRALAREQRRVFARYDGLDREWLDAKSARLEAIRHASAPASWTHAVVELVRAMRGEDEANRTATVFEAFEAEPTERRAKAFGRVLAIAEAMETGRAPSDLTSLYERLDAARDFPGRAKRRRTLDVLRRAIGWSDLPANLLGDDFVESARRAIALWPIVHDEQVIERFATLALLFRIGDEGAPSLAGIDTKDILALREHDLTLDQAVGLQKLAKENSVQIQKTLARHVAAGLDLELLRTVGNKKQLDQVASLVDVRSVRAFITWSGRLKDHYTKHGLELNLSPELFLELPKNEDLAVLTHCLLDHHAEPSSDPIGTLDATLGLFQRLPARASALLQELRRAPPGEGRRLDPDFAAFVGDDALLDRSIHIAKLAGEPALSAIIREDFERTARLAREREHLESLTALTLPQQHRLAALREPIEAARRDRTLRRLRGRIERLLPTAYRRGLDETFRRLLREGWGIRVAKLTDAWREAVRFWLTVDDNREHLEKLLREAALRPGRSVKDAFPRNLRWLRSMKDRVDVDAWMAPRRKEIEHAGARMVIELEEDPLEVMKMGIPFGTCLSLADGSNAASTVLNAIEANKRVLYVRNAAGKIVARKLLGLTNDGKLVGYRLYRSVGGEEESAIMRAVATFCEELAEACRAPRSGAGSPRKLHKGFWYDDGEVPFEGTKGALARFCEGHGLPPPPRECDDDDALVAEAEAWLAREANDADQALRVLERSTDSPAMRVHDAWTIRKIGLRRAIRVASNDSTFAFALFHTLAVDEPGLVLAMEAASRLPESHSDCRLRPVVRRFPPSAKTNVALVDLALRAMKHNRRRHESDRGHVHTTLDELPGRFEDVASALDLLDAIEPAWRWFVERVRECADCAEKAIKRSAAQIEELYERAPEPEAVTSALMSRRRGLYAHLAALRIAARHVLPGGERALRRFAVLRPELMTKPDAFAALVRQSNGAITCAPEPDEAPFAALRDLVALPDLHRFLGRWDTLEGDPKTTWEAAWRRRRRNDPCGGYDAAWVESARKKLVSASTPDAERDAARTIVLDTKDGEVVDWLRLVATCARLGDRETARRVLEEIILPGKPVALSPSVVVDLWRLGERDVVVKSFEKTYRDEWSGRIEAAERAGDASGLLEAVALELAKMTSPSEVVTPNTKEQLERVLEAIVRESAPAHVASVFVYLEDALSVITFRDALGRQSAARVAAIKEEIGKHELKGTRSKTFLSWIRDIGGIESA